MPLTGSVSASCPRSIFVGFAKTPSSLPPTTIYIVIVGVEMAVAYAPSPMHWPHFGINQKINENTDPDGLHHHGNGMLSPIDNPRDHRSPFVSSNRQNFCIFVGVVVVHAPSPVHFVGVDSSSCTWATMASAVGCDTLLQGRKMAQKTTSMPSSMMLNPLQLQSIDPCYQRHRQNPKKNEHAEACSRLCCFAVLRSTPSVHRPNQVTPLLDLGSSTVARSVLCVLYYVICLQLGPKTTTTNYQEKRGGWQQTKAD